MGADLFLFASAEITTIKVPSKVVRIVVRSARAAGTPSRQASRCFRITHCLIYRARSISSIPSVDGVRLEELRVDGPYFY